MATVKFFCSGAFLIVTSVVLANWVSSCWFSVELTQISLSLLCLITGVMVLLGLVSGSVLLFISTQRVSKHHSIFSALHLFIVKYHRLHVGSKMLRKFRSACRNPRETQENLLQEIRQKNKDTEYGRQFHLDQILSLDDFRKKHPITEYGHYKPFVDRVSKGERNVMTTEKVSRLVLTSGTTGDSKLIPQNEYRTDNTLIIQEAFQQEMSPDLHPMQPKLKVHINSEVKRSECGITVAPATALEEHMTNRYAVYTPPPEGQMIGTVCDAFYIDLLFALREKELGSSWFTFSSALAELMKFLERNWPKLVDDLSNGTIRSDLKLIPRARAALTSKLGSGDPARAMEVKLECQKGFDGIIKRLWPNCQFFTCIDNIGIRNHMKSTYGKGIEIYSHMYICSEAFLGLNLWPFEDGVEEYALNLTETLYEFVKEEDMDKENPKTYFVDEVEMGQKYELLLSQKYGLYRFRLGDVVKVTGYYQNCPKVAFLYRKASILNLLGEKVDQEVVRDSLTAALRPWKDTIEMKHYACAECGLVPEESDSKKTGLYYVFFLELKCKQEDNLPKTIIPEDLAKDIQTNLCQRHNFYNIFVNTKQITTPTVYLTKEGAFLELKEYILANSSASRAQFKMPIKLRTREMACVLLKSVSLE